MNHYKYSSTIKNQNPLVSIQFFIWSTVDPPQQQRCGDSNGWLIGTVMTPTMNFDLS
jgi:hypothetical protein